MKKPIKIGIDASNIGGGGGITHLNEILKAYDKEFFADKIAKIIVFGSSRTLNRLPNFSGLEKQTYRQLNRNVIWRLFFQIKIFDSEIKKLDIDILLSLTGDYIGSFKPLVGMSRNMLLYEREIWKQIKSPKEVIRFWLNYQKQKKCFKNSSGVIFISNYAKSFITSKLNLKNKEVSVIHHGISSMFIEENKKQYPISEYSNSKPYKLLYVSTVHVYKNQWNVVRAIGKLRSKGYPVTLDLVGGVIFEPAGELLLRTIEEVDKEKNFINYQGDVEHENIRQFYQRADGIIFGSTCENMPNILLESMASGSPIACSNKEPMPEFLKGNGFYFDALDVESITNSVEKMLLDQKSRTLMVKNNLAEIKNYSWKETSKNTFSNIIKHYKLKSNA